MAGRRFARLVAAGALMLAGACATSDAPSAPAEHQQARTGTLVVRIAGVPAGATAAVSLLRGDGISQSLTTSTTLNGLAQGTYALDAQPISVGGDVYAPSPASQSVAVAANGEPATASVTYTIATGALVFSAAGVPAGAGAVSDVTGPAGFTATLAIGDTLKGLAPGAYVASPRPVLANGNTYAPAVSPLSVYVAAGLAPATLSVSYVLSTGAMNVRIQGLPQGTGADVTVAGPGGWSATLAATTSLAGLAPGSYTVTATSVGSSAAQYVPSPSVQTVDVTAGDTASALVAYAGSTSLNLTIAGLYVTQAVQTPARDVPLVAGRDGLLRVFVSASQSNTAQPAVRVRVYNGTTLVDTRTIAAPAASVPTAVNDATLSGSWNVLLPGAELQPGSRLLVEVDPDNAVVENSETDNVFPPSGTPLALDVRTVATYNVRLVPVAQSANGNTGNVSAANKARFVAPMLQMFPLSAIDADVRATYTTSAPALESSDANGAWEQILSEINALRTADGSTRPYYGVVHTSYTSGVAGLGYVPGRAAIGWDYLPSGAQVMAHETGHNFGRYHAPSCGAGGADQSYPWAAGKIGVQGWDPVTGSLRQPAGYYDLMGYCNPVWISDYTYEGILDYRAMHPDAVTAKTSALASPSLLVWGRVHNGVLILEPAYEVDTRPRLPVGGGDATLAGYAADGTRLFSFSFTGERIADAPDPDNRTFAFAIPLDSLRGRALDRLTLSAPGRVAERRARGTPAQPVIRDASEEPLARRVSAGEVRVTWKDDGVRGVLIRDARTGDILAFGRDGAATVRAAGATALDVVVSDGVRSVRRRLTPR